MAARARVTPRAVASPARIALFVEKTSIMAPGLGDEVAAELREQVLESRVGVPVQDASKADLLLKVVISGANFTHATQWEYQLIDVDTDAVLVSRRDTAAWGRAADDLAAGVMQDVARIDTAAYAGPGKAAPVVVAAAGTVDAPLRSATDGSKSWAVVIGVEGYREGLTPATGAEADARAFAAFARTTLGVPEANTKLLVGDRATRADLSGALLEWLPRNAVEPGGTVYVFFSGHGAPDTESGDAYLVPYDANPAYIKTGGLPLAEVQRTLGALKGQRVYLFLDACFSGQGDRSVLAQGTRPLVPVKPLAAATGLVTLAASGATETTGTHAGSGHGLFTYHLLAGLGGAADADGDHAVSLAELRDHLITAVRTEARRQNRDQTPSVAVPGGYDVGQPLVQGLQ
ncbi:MAG: caspase family protein [bacterium]